MDTLIAALASGALMAKVFISVWCVSAFFLLKDPPPAVAALTTRFPPGSMVMGVVVAAYPIWGVVALALAFLFLALQNALPGAGLGSPNAAYSVGVSLASALIAAPLAIAFRLVWRGIAATALASIGIFGWLLPFLAS